MLMQLIYASQETRPMSEEDLVRILQGARDKNQQYHVTGMLVYKNGIFLQILEGQDDALETIWEIIQADSRHDNIVEIRNRPIKERDFSDWAMGFTNLSGRDFSSIPGYSHFLDSDFSLENLHTKPGFALDFLLSAKEINQE